ncbi:MAG: nitrate reductase molybdenum cofactor assembly chaperone, partial [Pseudomonadota bacterium]|nr:nitrate reductase molybdenum cofactor assembly chaperone [Pseudomonadota bacterium]
MQLLKVLARVLEYPNEELQASKDALTAAVLEDSRLPRQNKEQLLRCLDRLCSGDLLDLQEAYV